MGKTGYGAAAALLAFLAGQHHTLHMALLMGGLGGLAGSDFMTDFPAVRRIMLLASLAMVGVAVARVWRHRASPASRYAGGASAVLALGMIAWAVAQFGV